MENIKNRVLAVDDNPQKLEILRDMLAGMDIELIKASSGREALKLLLEGKFAVILMDVSMPEMDGFETAGLIRQRDESKETPIIFITAYQESELKSFAGYQAGAVDYLVMPIVPQVLQAKVKVFCELFETRKKLELLNNSLEARVQERTAALTREIQARTRAEKDLRDAMQREDMVLRALPLAFFSAKPEKDGLRIEWASEGVEKLCGYKPGEFLAARGLWLSRIHPEDKERVLADIVRLRETKAISTEYRWQAAGGEYRWFLASANSPDGRVLGLWLDISEKKTLELQFREAQKMEAIGRLAGGIAHDFNNLLTAIEGYSDFLLKSLAPDDERRGDAAEIKKAAESAATLTRQLLAFSRRQIFRLKVLDCNAVICNTQKMLKRLIGENITLALDLAKEECRIKADPGQLEQIIMNLIVNARDAMPRGGGVTIKTENVELDESHPKMHLEGRPGPHVMISVMDTGSGMAAEVISHIFEPFFTTKEVGKGTGLGLAMVYGIVKQSGGNIYVYSEPGLGTTFKIYLPRVTEEIKSCTSPARPKALRGTETILVADDDDGVRGFTLRALRESGYTVLEARDGKEAARLCGENAGKISLVLTDTIMPGMDGHELYGLISRRWPEIKVIFMSGYTDMEPSGAREAYEILPFLPKPVSMDALVEKVREVLDAPAAVGV